MRGSCLCGTITYEISGNPRAVVECHCNQCRKMSGHYVAATRVAHSEISIQGSENLTWYASSDIAKRGFCRTCGSQLFWQNLNLDLISVMAGTIDGATGLQTEERLFADCKGDYYALAEMAGDAATATSK